MWWVQRVTLVFCQALGNLRDVFCECGYEDWAFKELHHVLYECGCVNCEERRMLHWSELSVVVRVRVKSRNTEVLSVRVQRLYLCTLCIL